jgi:hypothetical protein
MEMEDSYVIGISRRTPPGIAGTREDPSRLAGVIECPATGQRQVFHTIEELWTALAGTGSLASGGQGKPIPREK